MDEEEKLIYMFNKVHGELSKSVSIRFEDGEGDERDTGISVIKGENFCWFASKLDILFDYTTLTLGE